MVKIEMAYEEQREELLFAVFGKENLDKEKADTSFVFEKDKPVECKVLKIDDSEKYGKLYRVQINDTKVKLPVLITGKRAFNEAMGYGTKVITPVKEGDSLRLTYLGMNPTKKGHDAYNIKVEVDRS